MRCNYTRMVKMKTTTTTKKNIIPTAWEDVDQLEVSDIEKQNGKATLVVWQFVIRIHIFTILTTVMG